MLSSRQVEGPVTQNINKQKQQKISLSVDTLFLSIDVSLNDVYCLPDSRILLIHKSRDFVQGYSRFARYCLPDRPCGFVVRQEYARAQAILHSTFFI